MIESFLQNKEVVNNWILYRLSIFLSGDAFQSVSKGGDAYVLSRVIHNWNDKCSLRSRPLDDSANPSSSWRLDSPVVSSQLYFQRWRWPAASVVERLSFIVAISIVVGAAISLLTSSERISEKRRDELVRKSDDQSWRF
jgi:hypothetical protein